MIPSASGFAQDWAWAGDLRFLLFDFDGPICGLFAGHDTTRMADDLRELLKGHAADLTGLGSEANAHTILRRMRGLTSEALAEAVKWLTGRECEAVATAQLTPGVQELIEGLTIPMAVASNNAFEAIEDCLSREGLLDRFSGGIHGRDQNKPWLMKPHPNCIERALDGLGVADHTKVALIGDSEADAVAAEKAGIHFIGYVPASKGPAKVARLAELGARGVVTDMADLTRVFVDGCE
jgi:beta-phosphoglucomutase-like phosphatase (HAD superfamily)